ncbi:pyridoxamine 5'-phosphate oxidase family protein [Microbacterium trichothecenolyticum]|uniref:Pyridoxamine 5'-phosphate oxidase n=1 Tax=Microbacterium trichothecenolyticum TaxID=69370 RepID=A0A0M2H7E3_MICTR|nr:pyridoxamine 5'-phosphate oxidase family protein [Microbacterium trichothecenolyticum]KJL42310.1 Pyridoxamine 5'-phosphate oxidase [Microbacterium trichothecenolyticum]
MMRPQRRSLGIVLTDEERDDFLSAQRTARVATLGSTGAPHVMPLWFVWRDGVLWLNSLVRSARWENVRRDPRASAVVDSGEHLGELKGVEIQGELRVVGEVPRTTAADPTLEPVEAAFAAKYRANGVFEPDGRHAWLALHPHRIITWDMGKRGKGRASPQRAD